MRAESGRTGRLWTGDASSGLDEESAVGESMEELVDGSCVVAALVDDVRLWPTTWWSDPKESCKVGLTGICSTAVISCLRCTDGTIDGGDGKEGLELPCQSIAQGSKGQGRCGWGDCGEGIRRDCGIDGEANGGDVIRLVGKNGTAFGFRAPISPGDDASGLTA